MHTFARRLTSCSLGMLAAALAACGGRDETPVAQLSYSVDSSGTVPVTTVAGEPPGWSLDALAVIRSDPDVGFSRVRSVALDPRGGVWVADVGETHLSRWSDAGEFVEERGRQGSGPGEFQSPSSVVVHDGGLLVLDPANSRIVRFALTSGTDSSWIVNGRLSGDGMSIRLFPAPNEPLMVDFDTEHTPPAMRYVPLNGGGPFNTAPRPAAPPNDTKVCQIANGGIAFQGSPFAPTQLRAPYRGQALSVAADYRIERYGPDNSLASVLERPVVREAVTDADFEAALATKEWASFTERTKGAACEGETVRYAEKPAVIALLPDADGRLWVERRMPGRTVYEVWQGDSLLAMVPAPERVADIAPAMLGDRLAVVVETDVGGHEVQLYRVVQSESDRR